MIPNLKVGIFAFYSNFRTITAHSLTAKKHFHKPLKAHIFRTNKMMVKLQNEDHGIVRASDPSSHLGFDQIEKANDPLHDYLWNIEDAIG